MAGKHAFNLNFRPIKDNDHQRYTEPSRLDPNIRRDMREEPHDVPPIVCWYAKLAASC